MFALLLTGKGTLFNSRWDTVFFWWIGMCELANSEDLQFLRQTLDICSDSLVAFASSVIINENSSECTIKFTDYEWVLVHLKIHILCHHLQQLKTHLSFRRMILQDFWKFNAISKIPHCECFPVSNQCWKFKYTIVWVK